jgi:hypothetical protein
MTGVVHIIIRELIVEGTREGLAAARARGQRLGQARRDGPQVLREPALPGARRRWRPRVSTGGGRGRAARAELELPSELRPVHS